MESFIKNKVVLKITEKCLIKWFLCFLYLLNDVEAWVCNEGVNRNSGNLEMYHIQD